MTTPGNNGASTPEDDDPFGYLYEDGRANGATPPSGGGGYGYPGQGRTYNQVRTVGERQYGVPPQQPPAPAYDQGHYAAPETFPGGQTTRQQPLPGDQGGGRGRGGGPNTKGLLIGAIAVVAVVVVGIGVALITGDDDKGDEAGGDTSGGTTAGQSVKPSEEPSKPAEDVELPKDDAKALQLAGGTAPDSTIPGSRSGTYVAGLNNPGASATWTVNGIPKDGKYRLKVYYGVPGKKMSTTLSINGKMQDRKLNLDNFGHGPEGDWEKGWTNTWANILLNKGTNTIKISCETGDTCDVNLDQVELVKGWK